MQRKVRPLQIDFVFPVSWTCKNLASQPKKKRSAEKKQRAKLIDDKVFGNSCTNGI